jgi:hypothetical protein
MSCSLVNDQNPTINDHSKKAEYLAVQELRGNITHPPKISRYLTENFLGNSSLFVLHLEALTEGWFPLEEDSKTIASKLLF